LFVYTISCGHLPETCWIASGYCDGVEADGTWDGLTYNNVKRQWKNWMTITEILEQAKALSPQERKELAKLLIDMADIESVSTQRRLSELRGLGKEIWEGVDAQAYINQMRDEWDESL
jgi:hypothetical protein